MNPDFYFFYFRHTFLIRSLCIFSLLILQLSTCKLDELNLIFTGNIDPATLTEITGEIEGIILNNKGSITQHGHCWIDDSTKVPTVLNNATRLGNKAERSSFKSFLIGLAPNTGYAIRGYAVVAGDTVYGNLSKFKTKGDSKPALTITQINEITNNSAAAVGRLNKVEGNISQHGHCWISANLLNQEPTIADNKTELGTRANTGDFTSQLRNLFPDVTYRVRAYVIINGNPLYSSGTNFITAK